MAFKDITKVLYEGRIKIDYKDKTHRYYVRPRVNWDLPETDAKAWGAFLKGTKGTTTLIENTLEKKGLMTWPMGLALTELFGFYDFDGSDGQRKTGFKKNVGTMWQLDKLLSGQLKTQESLLPIILSASRAWTRRQKKGADIGSIVHDAIEHHVTLNPNKLVPKITEDGEPVLNKNDKPVLHMPELQDSSFDIAEQYNWNIKEADLTDEQRDKAFEEAGADVEMATLAFNRFKEWWATVRPILFGAEDLLYSEKLNVCGTYDADLGIPRAFHPRPDLFPGKELIRVTTDWKTSNASKSEAACMPEGVNYQYFVQNAIYEKMRREMGEPPADDLLIVSARKDGGFTTIYASELGFTVDECIEYAEAVITCYRAADKLKQGLVAHAAPKMQEGEF